MTPYEITLLINFHALASPLAGVEPTKLRDDIMRKFTELELVNPDYSAGPALKCYIEAICNIPPPVKNWTIPKEPPHE